MPLIRRVPWTVQPQSAARTTRASIAAYLPGSSVATLEGTTTLRPTDSGMAVGGNGTNNGVLLGSLRYPTEEFTYVLRVRPGNSTDGAYLGAGASGAWSFWQRGSTWQMSDSLAYKNSALSITVGQWTTIALSIDAAGNIRIAANGRLSTASLTTAVSRIRTADTRLLCRDGPPNNPVLGEVALALIFPTAFSGAELVEATRNPWQLFQPRRIIIPVSTGAGGGISGDLSQTLGGLTSSATGTLALSGTASQTLAALTSAATGAVAIAGTASPSLAAVTSAATGAVAVKGTTTQTLADLTLAGTGLLQAAGTGTLAQTMADATLSAAGALALKGAAAPTLSALTSTSTGKLSVAATLSRTLDAAALNASGVIGSVIAGSLSATLANVTASATGRCDIAASLGLTLGNLTLAAAGTAPGTFTLAPPGAGYQRPHLMVQRPMQTSAQRLGTAKTSRPGNPRR